MHLRVRILALGLLLACAGCRGNGAKGPAPDLLAEGMRQFKARNYKDAEYQFLGIRARHPESDEAEEGIFMLAKSQRLQRDGESAFRSYKEVVEKFPNSRFAVKVAEGQYKLGIDYLEGRMPGFLFFGASRDQGVDVLENMQIHFRNHRLADDALMRVSDFHLKQKDYSSAADSLRRLLAEYPRSEHTLRARFQLGQALFRQSRGPLYDTRLLYDARRAYADFVATVHQDGLDPRYGKQIAAAERMVQVINDRLAERQYETGRFYERTGAPQSALYYYRVCMHDFGQSEFARKSRERIRHLGGRADAAAEAAPGAADGGGTR